MLPVTDPDANVHGAHVAGAADCAVVDGAVTDCAVEDGAVTDCAVEDVVDGAVADVVDEAGVLRAVDEQDALEAPPSPLSPIDTSPPRHLLPLLPDSYMIT